MSKFYYLILKNPRLTLGLIGFITIVFIFTLKFLNYDFAIEQLFAQGKPSVKEYFEFQNDFSREDNVIMMIHEYPDDFNKEYLDGLSGIVKKLKSSEYFNDVYSFLDIIETKSISSGKLKYNESKVPFKIVSIDSSHLAIWVSLKDKFNTHELRSKVVKYIKKSTGDLSDNWIFSGIPVVRTTYVEYMIADNIKFIPPVGLLLIFVLGFLFRHWVYVVIPLLTVTLTAIWILGFMSLTGKGLNIMTYMVPTLLFIIGVSDSIHLLSRMNIYLSKDNNLEIALINSMRDMGKALFLTSLTTAAGFLALLYASIEVVRDLGLFIAIGVFIAYFLTMTFIPASIMFLKTRINFKKIDNEKGRQEFLKRLGLIIISNPLKTISISLIITFFFSLGIFYIKTDSSLLSDLHPESGLYKDLKKVEKLYGGVLPLEIVISRADSLNINILDSISLSYVSLLHKHLEYEVPNSQWISPYKLLKSIAYEIDTSITFPISNSEIEELIFIANEAIDKFLNFDQTKMRISGLLPDLTSLQANSLENSIDNYVNMYFPSNLKVIVTGTMPIALKTNSYLVKDLFGGFGIAFIFISITMGLLFLSIRMGLLSIIPNVFPILFAAGFLGFSSIAIRPPTAITFAVCLGIAVDDTLHFLFKFWQERKAGHNPEVAVLNTIQTTGLAMLTSTMVLVAGFLVLTFSTFIPTSQFGLISAITLTVAVLIDLTLLPALLVSIPIRTKEEKNFSRI